MNILIVEDDRSLNKGIALTLSQNNVMIHQAYDIAAAEHIFAVNPIDLIILTSICQTAVDWIIASNFARPHAYPLFS